MPILEKCWTSLTKYEIERMPLTTTVPPLLHGEVAQYNARPNHLEPMMIIDHGVIIINDATAIIKEGKETKKTWLGTRNVWLFYKPE